MIRLFWMVTLGARTSTHPEMSCPSMTAPGWVTVSPPAIGVSLVPAGTPAEVASGNPQAARRVWQPFRPGDGVGGAVVGGGVVVGGAVVGTVVGVALGVGVGGAVVGAAGAGPWQFSTTVNVPSVATDGSAGGPQWTVGLVLVDDAAGSVDRAAVPRRTAVAPAARAAATAPAFTCCPRPVGRPGCRRSVPPTSAHRRGLRRTGWPQ